MGTSTLIPRAGNGGRTRPGREPRTAFHPAFLLLREPGGEAAGWLSGGARLGKAEFGCEVAARITGKNIEGYRTPFVGIGLDLPLSPDRVGWAGRAGGVAG